MKTDIQIAQEARMLPIRDVAAGLGIKEDDLELYGRYKAKLSDQYMRGLKKEKDGKLILLRERGRLRFQSVSDRPLAVWARGRFWLFASPLWGLALALRAAPRAAAIPRCFPWRT